MTQASEKALNEVFDLEPVVKALTPLVVEPFGEVTVIREPVAPADLGLSADQTDDYEFARGTLRHIMSKANTALDGCLAVAQESDSARAYEVAANLMKHLSDISKDLISLHKTVKDLKPQNSGAAPGGQGTVNMIDKAVFVGSPSDLLDQIKYSKE